MENLTLTGAAAINGRGNTDNNILTGNLGVNVLDGLAGADTMIGGDGSDGYVVDNVGDIVTEALNAGTDTVSSSVTYTLSANVENLTLTGAAAINGTGNTDNNILTGNNASNTLSGGAGADRITGGSGADTLSGGADADIFIYLATGDTGTTAATRDNITDFVHLTDILDMSAIDANTGIAGNQAFTLINGSAFSAAGQLRFTVNAAGNTILQGNVNANLAADFEIQLTGNISLTTADFVL